MVECLVSNWYWLSCISNIMYQWKKNRMFNFLTIPFDSLLYDHPTCSSVASGGNLTVPPTAKRTTTRLSLHECVRGWQICKVYEQPYQRRYHTIYSMGRSPAWVGAHRKRYRGGGRTGTEKRGHGFRVRGTSPPHWPGEKDFIKQCSGEDWRGSDPRNIRGSTISPCDREV